MKWSKLVTAAHGFPFAIIATCAMVAALFPIRSYLASSTVMLALVPVIIGVASAVGMRPAGAAAVLGFLLVDVLFVQPYYHLTVASPSEWIALLVFLITALVAGQQAALVRARERTALDRQRELELLNLLSLRLGSEASTASIARFIVEQIVELLGVERAALYVAGGDAGPVCLAETGPRLAASVESATASWSLGSGKAVGLVIDALPAAERMTGVGPADALPGVVADGVYVPLQTGYSLEGVLYARWPGRSPDARETRLVAAIANLAAASLGHHRVSDMAARAEALRVADRLKTTLISSVSHELKTPLSAAVVRLGGLLEGDGLVRDPAAVHSELAASLEDLARLDGAIGGLVDMSRLESDAWRPRFEEHEISDVLGIVLDRVPRHERDRVRFALPEDLPPVRVDLDQAASAFLNVVQNALAYSPPPQPVTVAAGVLGGMMVVAVSDLGPGVPDSEKQQVFGKFHRGASSAGIPGTGLGLTIAAEIAGSHGGRLWVEDNEPAGARFVMSLPISGARGEG